MISILMPIKNGAEFLPESLSSVVAQTYQRWELVIGINGLPAGSDVYQDAHQFNSSKIKVIELPEARDKSQALNAMLEHTKFSVLCLIDVDDIWLPRKLQMQMKHINDHHIVGTDAIYFGERSGHPGIPLGRVDVNIMRRINPVVNSSAMFYKCDAHWESVTGVEDYEMWCRLAAMGRSFYNVPETLVKHRIHSNSAFNTEQYLAEINTIRKRHGFA